MRTMIFAALPLGLLFTLDTGAVTPANAGPAAQTQVTEPSARRHTRSYKYKRSTTSSRTYASRQATTSFAWFFAPQMTATPARTAKRSRSVNPERYAGGGSCGGNRVVAAWYQSGRRTASGTPFNPDGHTAAHRTLPFGSRVTVTNPRNGRSVAVTINDRGPFTRGVSIDLARGAARAIGMTGTQAVCMT